VRDALEEARQDVATLVGVTAREVVFTSGGTEAINAAVWGATRRRAGAPVLLADVEHSAVREASARSAPVEVVAVDSEARIQVDELAGRLADAGRAQPALVHCQWANHEVGTLQPVHEVVRLCRDAGVPVHVDAVAACGHVPLDLGALGADLVSLSAHKIGGLPGAGALIIRRGSRFEPFIVGGEQERARRAAWRHCPPCWPSVRCGGTGRRRAAPAPPRSRARPHPDRSAGAGGHSRDRCRDRRTPAGGTTAALAALCRRARGGSRASPHRLDRAGVAVHSDRPAPRRASSLARSRGDGVDASHSLRLSVGWSTTEADVAAFATAFGDVVAGLRALRS